MVRFDYVKLPIVDAARRCGLAIDHKTLRRKEVEATCPFCGDHGAGKYHLSLNTDTDQFRCNLCNASGNSVTLYARLKHLSNKEAAQELMAANNLYPLPMPPAAQPREMEPRPLAERHLVYTELLELLTLTERHQQNLLERGLSEQRIRRNMYRSLPETNSGRCLAAQLLSCSHELSGIPGFFTKYGEWTMAGALGFLIPVRDKNGLIQGLQIRLDAQSGLDRKYRWLSSRKLENGCRSYSWIHVAGDTTRKRAFLTEGPLKGEVASFLGHDALFICLAGVNAIRGLKQVVRELGVTELVEAIDMDRHSNPNVHQAVLAMRKELQSLRGVKYLQHHWDRQYNGIDEYLHSLDAGKRPDNEFDRYLLRFAA